MRQERNRYGDWASGREHLTSSEKEREERDNPERAAYFNLPLLLNGDLFWFSSQVSREEFKNTFRALAPGWGKTENGTII